MQTETALLVGGTVVMLLAMLGFVKPGVVMSEELIDKLLGLITSKRFLALVCAVGLIWAGDRTGFSVEDRRQAIYALMAFILGDSLRPTETQLGRVKRLRKEQAAVADIKLWEATRR